MAIVALAQWVRLQVVLNAVTISSKVDSSVITVENLDARVAQLTQVTSVQELLQSVCQVIQSVEMVSMK